MTDRSITVTLRANVGPYEAGMLRARRSTEDLARSTAGLSTAAERSAERSRQALSRISTGLGLLGAAALAASAGAVKAFADWDSKMAQVRSLTHAGTAEMTSLRDATKGFATQFGISASKAADAEIELVKAGVSVKDILGGALRGALTLASAGQLDVARATEIAGSALTQFGLEGKDVSHVADLLAAGADKALGSVDDLGQGLKFVGPVAHALGVSVDSTVGSLSELAQAGILGEQAGTGLRGVLQALVSPSQQAQKVMAQYGISLFDAQGKFIGLAGMAGQLHDKLGDLTQAEQSAALGMIFGNHQVTAATVLMQGGAAAVEDWTNKVNDSGFAAGQAAGKMDSLQGDLQKLGAVLKNDLVDAGSGANEGLRGLTQGATGLVEKFGELPPAVQQATVQISGAGGLAALGVAGLGKLVVGISNTRRAVRLLGLSARTTGIAFGAIGLAATGGLLALEKWGADAAKSKQQVDDLKDSLDQATAAITTNTRATIYKNLVDDGAVKKANALGISLQTVVDAAMGGADALANLRAAQDTLDQKRLAAGAAGDPRTPEYVAEYEMLTDIVDAATGQTGKLAKAQQEVRDQLAAGIGTTDENADAVTKLNKAMADGTATVQDYQDALQELVDEQQKAAGATLDLREAQRNFQQAIDDADAAVKKNGKTLDIHTQKGRDNQAALDAIAHKGEDLIATQAKQGDSEKTLRKTMAATRDAYEKAAEKMGLSKDQAKKLADQLDLIPKNIHVAVDANTAAASAAVNQLLRNIDQRVATINVRANLPTIPGVQRMGTYAAGGTPTHHWPVASLRDLLEESTR